MSTVVTPPAQKTRKTRVPLAVVATPPESRRPVTDEEIAARAFELYCERGAEDGHDLDDWLRAEMELRGHHRREVEES